MKFRLPHKNKLDSWKILPYNRPPATTPDRLSLIRRKKCAESVQLTDNQLDIDNYSLVNNQSGFNYYL